MKKSALPVLGVAALLTAATHSPALAERFTERFEETYQTAGEVDLRLSNTNGSVTVVVWDRPEVEIVAEKRVDARDRDDALEVFDEIDVVVEQTGGRIEVETRLPSRSEGFFDWLFGRARNVSVRYQIKVPAEAGLDLKTVNGSLTTEGTRADQLLRSTNGRITVHRAAHGVEAHTTNGSIQVEIVEASDRLDVELGTTNGSITLSLPTGAGATLDARTVNGSVRSELPLTIEHSASRRRMTGDINGGGPGRIGLRTTNGSVRIERARI